MPVGKLVRFTPEGLTSLQGALVAVHFKLSGHAAYSWVISEAKESAPRSKGRVLGYAAGGFALLDARPVVQPGARKRIQAGEHRSVHAWVTGRLLAVPNVAQSARMAAVSYNPNRPDTDGGPGFYLQGVNVPDSPRHAWYGGALWFPSHTHVGAARLGPRPCFAFDPHNTRGHHAR